MLGPDHEAALRQQILSLHALKMPFDHPFAAEMNETLAKQAVLLEEIRIAIHNRDLNRGASMGYMPALGREVFENDRVTRADLEKIASWTHYADGILRP